MGVTSNSEPLIRKAYYAMGEVCELTGLKPHVLRYWESQFDELRPVKNAAGNRVYRPKEVEFILLLRRLLHDEKLTLKGARQRLRELKEEGELEQERKLVATPDLLRTLRDELLSLRDLLAAPLPGVGHPGSPSTPPVVLPPVAPPEPPAVPPTGRLEAPEDPSPSSPTPSPPQEPDLFSEVGDS
jgi:DNA-binding transcriptional MerR regulator